MLRQQNDEVFTRERYDYMMKNGVPNIVNSVCQHLLDTMPADPERSIIQFLRGQAAGSYSGGVAVAGQNAGGGWVRIVGCDGTLLGQIDKLPLQMDGSGGGPQGFQLLASSPTEKAIFVVVSEVNETAGAVRKYAYNGELLQVLEFPKPVTAIFCDRARGHLFAALKGGGLWLVQGNGTKLTEISCPAALALHVNRDSGNLLLLTSKAIERRQIDSGHLEQAIHLPDSSGGRPCSFAVGERYVWVGSPNPDGRALFVGAYDIATGKTMPNYVPSAGCLLSYDFERGGVWQLARANTGSLAFHNDKGHKVMTLELGKAKGFNLQVNHATGALWILRIEFTDDNRLVLYDPLRTTVVADVPMPGSVSVASCMVPL